MPDIQNTFDLNRGDMLYGIGTEINRYLKRRFGQNTQVNVMKTQQYAAINTYNTTITGNLFVANGSTMAVTPPTSNDQRKLDYATALNANPKYAPSSVNGDLSANAKLFASFQKGRDTLAVNSPANDLQAAAKELAIRRSCKFGIDYAVSLPAKIHYILDSMDMDAVVNKTLFDKTITVNGVDIQFRKMSICTTELRFLFRNWQRLNATGNVQFYLNFLTVLPPWQAGYPAQTMAGWADYAHHRVEKAAATLSQPYQNQLAQANGMGALEILTELEAALQPFAAFRAARQQGHPAAAQITAFHNIPSNLVN